MGRSMDGTFRAGDFLHIEPVPFPQIHPGDIIIVRQSTVDREADDLVHRVIGKIENGLITQGDSNPAPDPLPVTGENLIGRVFGFERQGKTHRVSEGKWGLIQIRWYQTERLLTKAFKQPLGAPYFLLRKTGLVRKIWRPCLNQLIFQSPQGLIRKFTYRGKTVASIIPEKNRLYIRHPFDLILWRPLCECLWNKDQQNP